MEVGIEAMLVLRMEKGYLHIGSDTDGTTNPLDIGLERVIAKKQRDFLGRRSLDRPDDRRESRRQFVGVEPLDPEIPLRSGAHIVSYVGKKMRSEGFVTSAALSPTLGRHIGLAMVEGGFHRKGELVTLFDDEQFSQAKIVDPAFLDPEGKRARA
jgi:sarcosine oxidase subunit alpha